MDVTTFDDLRHHDQLRVWWSFTWRGLVISLCGALGGGIAGLFIGFAVGIAAVILGHYPLSPGLQLLVKILSGLAGFAAGLALSWLYIRWLFRTRLSGYKLLLVREPPELVV